MKRLGWLRLYLRNRYNDHGLVFYLFTSDGISRTSKDLLNIQFTKFALKEDSEEEKELRKDVKRVIEVIVGLLKDRMDIEREPSMKN